MHDRIPHFGYRLYGLTVLSELALPELPAIEHGGAADIVIRLARGEASDGFRLDIEDVAAFTISGGNLIEVDAAPGVADRNVRLFLLGSAMGVLLHQRGLLPLHANGVVIDGRAFAFTGPSGIGKSTLAAWFHDQGFPLLADDVCVLETGSNGITHALPGLGRIRMWKDALEASGRSVGEFERSVIYDDEEPIDKFDVILAQDALHHEAVVLGGIVELANGDAVSGRKLDGAAAVKVLVENTYRGHLLQAQGSPDSHFRSAVAIARSVPVLQISRPFDRPAFEDSSRAILGLLRQLALSPNV